ncbi:MAG: TIGR00366 family protein [Pseudomonadota bacterium]
MHKFAEKIVQVFQRYVPEPLAFGLLMTLVAIGLCWLATPSTPIEIVRAWGDGLSALLSFIAQVCLTILFAFTLAHLDPIPKYLQKLAGVPQTPGQAYMFCVLFTGLICLFAWPLGTIVGGLMARQVALSCAARGLKVHYPLLGGAAFSGFVVWHMGYTATAPLMVATPGNALESLIGAVIPVTQTILHPQNLLTIAGTLALLMWLAPRLEPQSVEPIANNISDEADNAALTEETQTQSVASLIENKRWLTTAAGLLLGGYLVHWFANNGLQLDLNVVNWSFLTLCLLLAPSARKLSEVMMEGGRAIVPTLMQYPIYGGIMGMMLGTGLVAQIAAWFAANASAQTLPFLAFLSGGLINLFVPSGGAQWAVQGPAFIEAAQQLGTPVELIVMGVAYGDQWTNIIHPFVVIPLLIMTGLKANQVLAYSFILFLLATVPLAASLLWAGFTF